MANSANVARADPKILRCSCKHEFQDRKYGPGRRVMNPTMKNAGKDGPTQYRCTACGSLVSG